MITVISWLFLAYFIILWAERVQSLIRLKDNKEDSDGFNAYVNLVTILSLAATTVLLAFFNKSFWISLFKTEVVPDFTMLSVTAGVLLIAGMVHTEKTLAGLQFGAYGALILAMILRTIETARGAVNPFSWWYSLFFVIIFSMAVPVVYPTKIKRAVLFYTIESVVSFALVTAFTVFLANVMNGNAANLLWLAPVAIVAIGDSIILYMSRKEEINRFLLTFGSATVLMFVVGVLIV